MSVDKQQTAVEWLISDLISKGLLTLNGYTLKSIGKAKEMDKQAHRETWDVAHQAGRFEGKGIAEENWQTFETHWEDNFKQQEQ